MVQLRPRLTEFRRQCTRQYKAGVRLWNINQRKNGSCLPNECAHSKVFSYDRRTFCPPTECQCERKRDHIDQEFSSRCRRFSIHTRGVLKVSMLWPTTRVVNIAQRVCMQAVLQHRVCSTANALLHHHIAARIFPRPKKTEAPKHANHEVNSKTL